MRLHLSLRGPGLNVYTVSTGRGGGMASCTTLVRKATNGSRKTQCVPVSLVTDQRCLGATATLRCGHVGDTANVLLRWMMAFLQWNDVCVCWSHVDGKAMTSDKGPADGDWRRPRNDVSGEDKIARSNNRRRCGLRRRDKHGGWLPCSANDVRHGWASTLSCGYDGSGAS
jgi:hypothetical protein